ncbi:hypothetical protein BBJ28_00008177 [Nothophytophthora sp. Chile5]|nr:hypothetical protein BBJ28_00008177 [Nothophytophthora sp. Chile5]
MSPTHSQSQITQSPSSPYLAASPTSPNLLTRCREPYLVFSKLKRKAGAMTLTDQFIKRLPHDVSPEKVVTLLASGLAGLVLVGVAVVHYLYGALTAGIASVLLVFLSVRWVYWNGVGVLGWRWTWLRNSDVLVGSLSSEPQQKGTLRVVCLSDTHGRHRNVMNVPDGDVLLHCGDFTNRGTHAEIRDFNEWLGTLPHRHKIVIAGNHDLCMDVSEYNLHWDKEFRHKEYNDPTLSRELLTNCTYVENRSFIIDGVKIYGSPMTPPIPGRVAAFNVARGFAEQQHWTKIPADVDVLVTHGPPNGILDKTVTGRHVGSETLLREIMSRVRPRFHLFGHIHEAYGAARVGKTVFVNCATNTLLGKPRHAPVVRRKDFQEGGDRSISIRFEMESSSFVSADGAERAPRSKTPPPQQIGAVYRRMGALAGLQFLQAAAFGVMSPIMSIVMTEVCDRGKLRGCRVADVVAPAHRAAAFGLVFAMLSVGYCISSFTHILEIALGIFTVVGFNVKDFGNLMLLGGILALVAQGMLLKPLVGCFKEKGVIVIAMLGSLLGTGGFIITAYYPHKWVVYALSLTGCISDLSFPAISSLKSINCSEKEQGRLQGAIYGARAVFEATGPVLFASLYAAMTRDSVWSQALPYVVASGVYVVGIGVALSLPVGKSSPSGKIAVVPPPLLSPTYADSPSSSSMYFETDDDDEEEEDGQDDRVIYADDGTLDDNQFLAEPLLGSGSTAGYAHTEV